MNAPNAHLKTVAGYALLNDASVSLEWRNVVIRGFDCPPPPHSVF